MSFIVEYNKGKLVKSEMLYNRTTPCPSYECKNGTFCIGEIFNQSFEDIASLEWDKTPDILNGIVGDIAIAKADNACCKFAVDLCGIDNLFYYHNNQHFLLSDNIWDIVSILEPTFDDLNDTWIRRNLVLATIDGETFINHLKCLMPCEMGTYDVSSDTLNVKEYREYRYTGEVKTLDEAVDTMELALDQMFRALKSSFGENCVYGMGLSGGLDSRVIPHYAKKHGLKLVSWNICTQRPNGILEANSVRNARKLANEFNIPFTVVEWKKQKLKEKLRLKTINMPMGTSGRNMFKYETEGIPKFDVMLSGGFGILVGDYFPEELPNLNKDGLKKVMKRMFTTLQSTSNKGRMERAINYIFRTNLNVSDRSIPAEVLSVFEKEKKDVIAYVDKYVDDRYGKYSNIEIFGSYWLRLLCTRDRNGAFESMFGTKRSFATYNPFVLKQIVRWNAELLPGRQVLPALIKKKMPYIADIATDSYTAAPNNAAKLFNRIGSIANRVIRGNGTAIDENNFDSDILKIINECLSNDCKWFYRIADTRKFNDMILNKKQLRFVDGIWEMKFLVDFIEMKGYQSIEH